MKFVRDIWELALCILAIVLVGLGGYFKSADLNDRIDRFERRMFSAEWKLGTDNVIRPIAKE